jgi:hypothetical protein
MIPKFYQNITGMPFLVQSRNEKHFRRFAIGLAGEQASDGFVEQRFPPPEKYGQQLHTEAAHRAQQEIENDQTNGDIQGSGKIHRRFVAVVAVLTELNWRLAFSIFTSRSPKLFGLFLRWVKQHEAEESLRAGASPSQPRMICKWYLHAPSDFLKQSQGTTSRSFVLRSGMD